MWTLPFWLPFMELFLIAIAVAANAGLLFLILTSQLHVVCRALFCSNIVAVLICASGQISINVWIICNDRPLGRDEFHFFPQVFVHQTGYYACACSFLLIIGERLLLCSHPSFYEQRPVHFLPCFASAIVFELIIAIPVVIAMQYESLSIACSTFVAAQEAFSLFVIRINARALLQMCKSKSEQYYRTKFATVNLNSRFEVRGVIELTTAVLPICALALSVKAIFFVLTFIAYYDDDIAVSDTHFLLRLACISYGFVFPALLISRVKTFRRRFYDFFPRSKVACSENSIVVEETPEASTRKHFNHLFRQWN